MTFAPNNVQTIMEYARFLSMSGKSAGWSDAAQGAAGPVLYLVTVGAKNLHLSMRTAISTGGSVTLTEAPTGWSGGSALVPNAYNRVTPPKFLSTFAKGPTGGSGGSNVGTYPIPVGLQIPIAAGIGSGNELLLKAGSVYLLTLTLIASGSYTFEAEVYEE